MSKMPFIIPVENQVRELDAKLLLACFGAAHDHVSFIGFKGAIDGYINSFPKGVYFAKSVTERSVKILRIAQMLGHATVAWDEEAVVHFPPEIYYRRRMSGEALEFVDRLLAWGADNKTLFEGYDAYAGTPITVVGNPRIDLLRPEFHPFYDEHVAAIRERYGDFILFNTNFGSVNGYYPELNVCYERPEAPGKLVLGRSAIGLEHDYALELYRYRKGNFDTMKQLVLDVAKAYPDQTIVVRPHPSENRDFWHEHVSGFANVQVNAEGNVVPWLLAASVLIHNSCTTGIESYLLDRPVIAYVPDAGADEYGSDLPNKVSHLAETPEETIELVARATNGAGLSAQDDARTTILAEFLTGLDGDFASERIVRSVEDDIEHRSTPLLGRAKGALEAHKRRTSKWLQTRKDSGRYGLAFKRQRFPELSPEALQAKAERLCALAGLDIRIEVRQARSDIFAVTARARH